MKSTVFVLLVAVFSSCHGNNDTTISAPAQKLSDYLWEQTRGFRYKALNTYFVQGIGDGSLDPTAFGAYMVQDAVYCYLARVSLGVAASNATEPNLKQVLERKTQSYDVYYKALYQQWHIAEANGIRLGDACQTYADYEHHVALTLGSIYTVVAITPCLKLWPWLGGQLQGKDHGVYKKWYDENFDPTYDGFRAMDDLIDAAEAAGTIDKTLALQVYSRCMRGEFEFFNSTQGSLLLSTPVCITYPSSDSQMHFINKYVFIVLSLVFVCLEVLFF